LEKWAATQHVGFDYIYLEKPLDKNSPEPSGLLLYQLRQDINFSLVFENEGTAIFKRR
jgi:hypothetical protein